MCVFFVGVLWTCDDVVEEEKDELQLENSLLCVFPRYWNPLLTRSASFNSHSQSVPATDQFVACFMASPNVDTSAIDRKHSAVWHAGSLATGRDHSAS